MSSNQRLIVSYQGINNHLVDGGCIKLGDGDLVLSFDANFDGSDLEHCEIIDLTRDDGVSVHYAIPSSIVCELRSLGVVGVMAGTIPFEGLDPGYAVYFVPLENMTAVVLDGENGPLMSRIIDHDDSIDELIQSCLELVDGNLGVAVVFDTPNCHLRNDLQNVLAGMANANAPFNGWRLENRPSKNLLDAVKAVRKEDWFITPEERKKIEIASKARRALVAYSISFAVLGYGLLSLITAQASLSHAEAVKLAAANNISQVEESLRLEGKRRVVPALLHGQDNWISHNLASSFLGFDVGALILTEQFGFAVQERFFLNDNPSEKRLVISGGKVKLLSNHTYGSLNEE